MPKVIRFLLTTIAAIAALAPAKARAQGQDPREPGEYIIVSGGVSLWTWEKWKAQPHDNWWMNFIRAARIRIQQLKQANANQQITWLVYRPNYVTRSKQDSRDYLSLISSVRDAYGVRLMWFDRTAQLTNYLNHGQPRDRVKINGFEYFGHSNKACFMFDYSNMIDSASKCWLHENDLRQIKRGIFTRDALVRSWGCHTGESMSQKFRAATGIPMWGWIGKTQYMTETLPVASTSGGRWTR
jgi:hypothetical protein